MWKLFASEWESIRQINRPLKIAARYPVKDCYPLKWFILVSHLGLGIVSAFAVNLLTLKLLSVAGVFVSYYFCNQHYKKITSSNDDLCWTGERWVMQSNGEKQFNLLPSSWLSSHASLLHLDDGTKVNYWLFTQAGIGERAFRELNFIARQNLVEQTRKAKSDS